MNLFSFKKKRSERGFADKIKAYAGWTYAVGDIHGRADNLNTIIGLIKQDIKREREALGASVPPVTLVFLGDYIDRGLESKAVIETLITLKIEGGQCIFLKGNHEQTILQFLTNADIGPEWSEHGAIETLASYGVQAPARRTDIHAWEAARLSLIEAIPASHMEFYKACELCWLEEPFLFVHAGIDPNLPMEAQTENELLWIRHRFLESEKPLPHIVVHGHTPEPEPVWDGRRIGLDTGAYMTGKLSAVRILQGEIRFLST